MEVLMARIWQTFGNDAHVMCMALLDEMNAFRLVPADGVVALKPNLVLAARPEDGAVTHPGVLSGCIEYLLEHGVARDSISVIESSWVGDRTMRAMRRAGYEEVLAHYDVAFYDLKRDAARRVDSPLGSIDVCTRALDAGLLIDLPVLKGHCQTKMTCALKNLKGCIPDSEKRRYHTLGLTRPIAALASVLRPRLTVVDAICGDLDFEEGGTPVETNLMYACEDPVTADAYGRALMGLEQGDVPYIELAERWGAGSTAWSEADVVTIGEPVRSGVSARPAGTVAKLTRNVHEDSACSACYASLVRALHAVGGYRGTISIGQGFRGKKISGLGIGRCCAGADECVMGCPPAADAIARCLKHGM